MLLFGASETYLFLKICASLTSKDDSHPRSPPYSQGYSYACHREGESLPYRILLPCIQLLVSNVQLRVLGRNASPCVWSWDSFQAFLCLAARV